MIYKILTADQWRDFQAAGEFHGAPIDLQDGFIHFSSADQLQGTLQKHFAGQRDLVVVEVDESRLPPGELKWETSRDNELFPHLYGVLKLDTITQIDSNPHDSF